MCGTSSRSNIGVHLLAGLLVAVGLLANTSASQEDKSSKQERSVLVYSFEYVDGNVLLESAQLAVSDAHLVLDAKGRRIIAIGPRSVHERLKELIKLMDVAPPEPDESDQIKVFSLSNSDANSMLGLIQSIVGNTKVKIAVDPIVNRLVAAGPESKLKVIEALLMRLDEKSNRGLRDKSYRVRIVWFAQEPANDKAVNLDEDLLSVQDELSKLGVKSIHEVGQTAVNTIADGRFQIGCSAPLGGGLAELKIKGMLAVQESMLPVLQIEISAEREEAANVADGGGTTKRSRLVDISTQIVAPLGHWVVLGVTPARENAMAFAVQIQRAE
jgi:hypothetical protein